MEVRTNFRMLICNIEMHRLLRGLVNFFLISFCVFVLIPQKLKRRGRQNYQIKLKIIVDRHFNKLYAVLELGSRLRVIQSAISQRFDVRALATGLQR